ncbi:MAG: RecQ family ATP-dependent DNA helicase [Succinivibrionaceae bacterium]|nr:RecQ family ATP-dependent DNA helicase [Succinivibrionaceae bacterium]
MLEEQINNKIEQYLRQSYGETASFKKDQRESIISTIKNRITLVVQKTGWGKSLVYFFSTKFYREHGYGPTIIISPLLSLMRNQEDAAKRLNLVCCNINHKNTPINNPSIRYTIENDGVDIIFITPEQLNKDEIQNMLANSIRKELALFVVDEAHCISEWGHDFRPDYCRIKKFINNSLNNPKLHILATTATANNKVIADLQNQFSILDSKINIIRGELIRDSLYIEIVKNLSLEQKFAWIFLFLKSVPGSGIIYCLTIRDTKLLAHYLRICNISAVAYHSETEDRCQVENDFYNNKIKVLVATSALGMGYDKPDISFVIHLQCPISMLEYYQQIGRAGRGIKKAKIILMAGNNDEKLAKYFIENTFPDPSIMNDILQYSAQFQYLKETDLLNKFNIKKSQMDAILKHLISRDLLGKNGANYYRTLKPSDLDEYIKEKDYIIAQKQQQYENMKKFIDYDGCLMSYISRELDDPYIHDCGKCSNCTNIRTEIKPDESTVSKALNFINSPYLIDINLNAITPKKKLPNNTNIEKIYGTTPNEQGYYLAEYGYGLGETVGKDKYQNNEFSSLLVNHMKDMIIYLMKKQCIVCENIVITYIPSLNRPNLVKDFAFRLANELHLPCIETLQKTYNNPPQKNMQNSANQLKNVESAFKINENCINMIANKNLYLIDDMVDSGWTFAWCGILLKKYANVRTVTPFALANTASN